LPKHLRALVVAGALVGHAALVLAGTDLAHAAATDPLAGPSHADLGIGNWGTDDWAIADWIIVDLVSGGPGASRFAQAPSTPSQTPAAPAPPQAPAAPQTLTDRAAERIRALQAEADRLAAQARTVFGDLRTLEVERAIKKAEAGRADAELARVTAAHAAAAERLAQLEATRTAQTPGVAERLIEIAKRGRGGYVQLLLASEDVRGFGRLSRGVAAIAELDRVRLESHRRTVAAEREALATLARERTAVAASQKEAARTRAALDIAVGARNRLIDDLDRRRDLAAQYVLELQRAQADIARTVASAGGGAVRGLPIRPFRGDLPWPADGPVAQPFGRAPAGRFGTAIVRNGIDLRVDEGANARAVHEGTVAYAAPFTGFGTLVIVDHGASAFTLYGHLAEATVSTGATVKRGEVVGRVGLAPAGDAALYFEVRIDGRPVDPLQWLRRSR
jgi:septal ring factor EnvC (AmiA/AmiB activator)